MFSRAVKRLNPAVSVLILMRLQRIEDEADKITVAAATVTHFGAIKNQI